MDKKNIKNKLRGSGILVVVLSSIVFSIYTVSTNAQQEHFSIMQNKYEKNIVSEYEKKYNDIESFYEEQIIKNNENNNMNKGV